MSALHHVELRCPSGNLAKTTLFVDGEPVTWAQRIELVLDAKTGESTVKVTVPAAVLDIDADAAAFVAAHAEAKSETFTQRGSQLRAKEAAELAVLIAEWQSIRDLHADSQAVLAVLDLHFPRRPWAAVQCDHCQTDSDSPEADHVPWPCATYTALTAKRGLPRIGDTVHIVEGGNCAISPVVGHIGDRDPFGDHGIIVTPGGREAEWLPTHQDETRTVEGSWHWPCSTELLAGSEPNAPAPVTVNITVQGSVGSEQGFAEAIRRDLLRHGNSQTWQSF